MPVIKSAKKKLRQDRKRTIDRAKTEEVVKEAVKKAVTATSAKTVNAAVSLLDKAAKKHIIHANKAARIKSRLAHLLNPKGETKTVAPKKAVAAAPKAKKTVKKSSAKKAK
ncbi:MAG TPA: 30S ribosomal protein S20 [Patescibacteria group bacterium]|nr:30S ribosomal protein S20 [Patescibacteria group bacterium]